MNTDDKRERVLREAFECRTQLLAYARALLGNFSAAEDAVQEALLVVVRKHEQFQEGTSMLAWCRSIVRLEVLRARQRFRKDRSLIDRMLDDAVDAAFDECQLESRREIEEAKRNALTRCMASVSERGMTVLRAKCIHGLSYEQIGTQCGMKLEAVRKMLFRVKKQLRECIRTGLRSV